MGLDFKKFVMLPFLLLIFLLGACSVLPEGAPGQISGDIIIDGSSTVYPITVAVAEEFANEGTKARVSVGMSGTGGGFKKFCPGETDINNASRPITQSEIELCQQFGVEYKEFVVALDGMTVVVNPDNTWLTHLTIDQLGKLFGVNSKVKLWSDLDSTYPDKEVLFFIPDPDSGTRDFMGEVIKTTTGESELRQDENTSFSSDDNSLLDGLAHETYAIGFFGYAYYLNNKTSIRAIPIENSEGEIVLPSEISITDGSYNPLSRPLFIYVNKSSIIAKPQVAAFLKFYFGEWGAPGIMSSVGYSLPPVGSFESYLAYLDALEYQ